MFYFTNCPQDSCERIFTNCGTDVPLGVVINPYKLYVNLFKGFDFYSRQFSIFPRRKLTSPL